MHELGTGDGFGEIALLRGSAPTVPHSRSRTACSLSSTPAGPEVRGPYDAMLLALGSRSPGPAHLTGEGVDVLTPRAARPVAQRFSA